MVFGGVVGGDPPEVKGFETLCLGVEDGSREEGDGSGEFFIGEVGSGLHVEASFTEVVIEEEGGGDDFIFIIGRVLVMDEVE